MKTLTLAALLFSLLFLFDASATAKAQAPAVQTASAPAASPAYNLPPDKLAQAVRLGHIRATLSIVGSLWEILVLWLLLSTGLVARLNAWAERRFHLRFFQGLLFFAVFLMLDSLASLPLDALGHAASLHYQISVQRWGAWFSDQGLGLLLSVVFGSLLMLLFSWIVGRSPRRYWLWMWLATIPVILLSVFAQPLVIDPLFNKFEPLTAHHAPLVQRLEQVVARTGTAIPPQRMFLMKASEKSNGINAYVTGIGQTKRFVMWDTTTDRLPDDEIQFIFGHESGHYILHHIPKIIGGSLLALLAVLWICGRAASWLLRRFGPRWQVAELGSRPGFLVLLLVLSAASIFLAPAQNTFSRHFEHEADIYGQEAIHGLVPDPQKTAVSAFNHLGEAWLEDPNPSPFLEFWQYNHPSVQTRARFAAQYNPWANSGHGRFFAK